MIQLAITLTLQAAAALSIYMGFVVRANPEGTGLLQLGMMGLVPFATYLLGYGYRGTSGR